MAEAEAWDAADRRRVTPALHSTYPLGSNAKTIVRHAKCPVLVARN